MQSFAATLLSTGAASFRRAPPVVRRAARADLGAAGHGAAVVVEAADALAHEVLQGPGWFDSSWDLKSGLEVSEGLPGDASLNEWIEACLRGA